MFYTRWLRFVGLWEEQMWVLQWGWFHAFKFYDPNDKIRGPTPNACVLEYYSTLQLCSSPWYGPYTVLVQSYLVMVDQRYYRYKVPGSILRVHRCCKCVYI